MVMEYIKYIECVRIIGIRPLVICYVWLCWSQCS